MSRFENPPTRFEVEAAIAVLAEHGVKRIAGYTIDALRRQIAVDPSARQAPMLLVLRAALCVNTNAS